jgi:succinoglycan biosynthesis protein ExoA
MSRLPFVSVLMPVRNEADFISRCLLAVLAQDYPRDLMEIIIIDGMSTDGTQEIVSSFQKQHPNIQLIRNPSRIVPTSLNLAISQAHGEIIIRVDGHCEIAPDYVSQCVSHLMNDQIEGVGGPIDTIGTTYISMAIACAMRSSFGVGNSAFRTVRDKTKFVDTVAFPAYTRRTIERAGPFDQELVRNQDDEYNYRLRQLGCAILLTPKIRSRYYSRSSILLLAKQYYQYGFWKVRVMQKHPRQMQLRQFAPPAFVASLIAFGLAAPISKVGLRLFTVIACTYMASNLVASTVLARSHGWKYLPVLPAAFASLHLSYGLGFLAGLVKFWNRWTDRGVAASTFAPPTARHEAIRSGLK